MSGGELAKALAAFQAECPRVGKGSTANAGTYSYQYADLAEINAVILPLLGKHGLSFSAKPTLVDGRFVLAYTLRHSSGESDEGMYPLPDPTKASPQQIGSNISYARRYAFCAVTGVAPGGDDDDGAAAQPASREVEPQWDPHEQEMLRDGFDQEIETASNEELDEIKKRIGNLSRNRTMSPNTYDHLAQSGARRRAELRAIAQSNADFAAAVAAGREQPAEQPTLPATTDTPTRRERQLAGMDAKVAQRKREAADATPTP